MPLQFQNLCLNHRLPHYLDFNPSSTPQLQESCNVTDWWASSPKQCLQDQIHSKSNTYKNQNLKFTPISKFAHQKFFSSIFWLLVFFVQPPGPWLQALLLLHPACQRVRQGRIDRRSNLRTLLRRVPQGEAQRCLTEALHASIISPKLSREQIIFQSVSILHANVCVL